MLNNSDTIQRGFTAIPPRFHRVPTAFPPRFHARTPAVLATVPERVSRSKKLTSAWKHAGRGRCVDFHANQFRGDAWKKFLPRELYCRSKTYPTNIRTLSWQNNPPNTFITLLYCKQQWLQYLIRIQYKIFKYRSNIAKFYLF